MQGLHTLQVHTQLLGQRIRQHRYAVAKALGVSNDHLPTLKTDVLDAQAQALQQA